MELLLRTLTSYFSVRSGADMKPSGILLVYFRNLMTLIGNTLTDEIDIRVPNYRIKYKRTRISKGSPVEYFDQEQTTDLPFGKL